MVCAERIKSALVGKKEFEKISADDQNTLVYILSKLILYHKMDQRKLDSEELKALSILLTRSGGYESYPPLSLKEQQEADYLMMEARSPDNKFVKVRLTSDEWEYLGWLMVRDHYFKAFINAESLNNGAHWALNAILDRVCRSLEAFMPGDDPVENEVITAILKAKPTDSQASLSTTLDLC